MYARGNDNSNYFFSALPVKVNWEFQVIPTEALGIGDDPDVNIFTSIKLIRCIPIN